VPVATRRLGNLPVELTSFVDRRTESVEITERMSGARLVTLTGVAGVGKTRLALHVAARLRRAFSDGVWLVELAGLHHPALLPHTLVNTLGIHDNAGRDPVALLSEFLAERRLLLVLDNCEHLSEACADLADTVLRAAGGVHILATSRQVLEAAGEHLYQVAPLPAGDWPATDLFVQRAAAVRPGFTVTGDNREHIADICRSLDGIPLAIELAAARLRVLSVRQLAAGLDDRFGGLPNQHTMRTALDWSYELCEPAERVLWARASVFVSGFDLEAAEEVCAGDGIAAAEVLDLVDGLVSKSIVLGERRAGRVRYRMLDTMRRYGWARLGEAGEQERLTRAHAQRYLRFAERAEREWFGPEQARWFQRLAEEHDNLRAALETLGANRVEAALRHDHLRTAAEAVGPDRAEPALRHDNLHTTPKTHDPNRTEPALRLAGALWFHWVFSGRVAEGRLWLEQVLARPGRDTAARAGALWTCALLASQQGDLETTSALATRARDLAARVGDPLTVARSVARLAIVANYRGESARAEVLQAESMAGYIRLGEAAAPYAVMARLTLAAVRLRQGDHAGATELAGACASTCRYRGDQILLANSLNFVAHAEWLAGDFDAAAEHVREALRLRREDTAALNLAQLVELLAWITASAGSATSAAVLLGAANRIWRTYGLERLLAAPFYRDPHQESELLIRRTLDHARFEAGFQRGAAMGVDAIVTLAIEEPATAARRPPPAARRASLLTHREREVADLIAAGLSNRDIAARLLISQRTAESHVEQILRKLGFTSRTQVAAWAARKP
jgi:predicted ATPase/DNA-binding CsgD family transcriptional regulator